MSRSCGGCTLCCELLEVKALDKPRNTRCVHCINSGCAIFGNSQRPIACSSYQCAWLFNESWSEELRPDRCGVVFEPFGNLNFTANVDIDRPDSWQRGAAADAISKMISHHCSVIVVVGNTKHVLLQENTTPDELWEEFSEALKECANGRC